MPKELGATEKRLRWQHLSGPISHDIAILSLRYPISRDPFLREASTPPKWCDTPPWYLILHRHICAIPHLATYRAITVRHPIKTKKQEQERFATLSLEVSRDMKSISAGPLRAALCLLGFCRVLVSTAGVESFSEAAAVLQDIFFQRWSCTLLSALWYANVIRVSPPLV